MTKSIQQFLKFGMIGGLNTVLTLIIYWAFVHLTNATIAMAVGYGATSLIGLLLNKYWVFDAQQNIKKIAWKYYATYGFTWLISVVFANLASSVWYLSDWFIPIGSLLITVPLNFLLNKTWVFATSHQTKGVERNGN